MQTSHHTSTPSSAEPDCTLLSPSIASRRLSPAAALLTTLLCVVTVLLSQFTFVLNVKVDGESIGAVPDVYVLETVIDTAEDAIETALGYHYEVAPRITYSRRLTHVSSVESLDPHIVELGIFYHVDGVEMQYALSLDGETVGTVADIDELQTAMEQRLERLEEEGALSAAFVTLLDYDRQLVAVEHDAFVEDVEEIVELLSVETVERVILTEAIPFDVDIIPDDELWIDHYEIVQEGLEGEMEMIALVTYIDGEPVYTVILQTKIIVEAVPEIVLEGTQVRPLTASWGYYIWPAEGVLSSFFGPRWGTLHQGIDIAAPSGTPVIAADGGEVIFTGWFYGYGNLIRILHDNGDLTYYAHLSSMDVSVGERVYRGQFIGRIGMTGHASGNHLHFEIRIDGIPVDPMPLLPPRE
ncbi:MAG: peptidoglycan DD-metalloendopeptidase family protein [Oscillospiraceae bacterium]|nr:peptidoglycan DD-metalloendopeptidase family protein [Oscillospiraceae bacterium]